MKDDRRIFWQEQIEAYRSSNLTARVWCEQNNINLGTLRKWMHTFNKVSKEVSTSDTWLPVEIANEPKQSVRESVSSGIRINIGTASIDVPSNFDPHTLESVLRIVSKTC